MATVLCLGEALIDFVAEEVGVPLRDCPGFTRAAGGAPANVAVGLSRLGLPSAFIGKVGDEPFGMFLAHTLAECGVDTRGMRFDPDHRTGLAFVSLFSGGERQFVFYRHPSADMHLRPEEVDISLLDQAGAFHFGSVSLIAEPSRSATLWAAGEARRRGKFVSYDPNLRMHLWASPEDARREALAAVPLADLVKVSAEEVAFLCPEGSGASFLAMGPRLVCVTRGADGCICLTADDRVVSPGFAVEAVDTTGAGDGFVAGFLSSLMAGEWATSREDLEHACRFANAVGALTCTQKGAIPALPTRAAVERFLSSVDAD